MGLSVRVSSALLAAATLSLIGVVDLSSWLSQNSGAEARVSRRSGGHRAASGGGGRGHHHSHSHKAPAEEHHKRHHGVPHAKSHTKYAYPLDFFMMSAPDFDRTPLDEDKAQRLRNAFDCGIADNAAPSQLVRAGVFKFYPLSGGIFRRREPVKYIVLHSTETGIPVPARNVINGWNSGGRRHPGTQYVVDRDGTILQAVDPELAAVHVNIFKTLPGINNDNTIGIEMNHTGRQDYPQPQRAAVIRLVCYLQDRFGVTSDNVITHKYAQQGDHTDPVNMDVEAFLATKEAFRQKSLAIKRIARPPVVDEQTEEDSPVASVYVQIHGLLKVDATGNGPSGLVPAVPSVPSGSPRASLFNPSVTTPGANLQQTSTGLTGASPSSRSSLPTPVTAAGASVQPASTAPTGGAPATSPSLSRPAVATPGASVQPASIGSNGATPTTRPLYNPSLTTPGANVHQASTGLTGATPATRPSLSSPAIATPCATVQQASNGLTGSPSTRVPLSSPSVTTPGATDQPASTRLTGSPAALPAASSQSSISIPSLQPASPGSTVPANRTSPPSPQVTSPGSNLTAPVPGTNGSAAPSGSTGNGTEASPPAKKSWLLNRFFRTNESISSKPSQVQGATTSGTGAHVGAPVPGSSSHKPQAQSSLEPSVIE